MKRSRAEDASASTRPKAAELDIQAWTDCCGVCRRSFGDAPLYSAPPGDADILACAACPRAYHAKCLGLDRVPAADRARPGLPWLDASSGHWLCAVCEGDVPTTSFATLDAASAAALATTKQAVAVSDPRGRARAALEGVLAVVDMLLTHDFGYFFQRGEGNLRQVRADVDSALAGDAAAGATDDADAAVAAATAAAALAAKEIVAVLGRAQAKEKAESARARMAKQLTLLCRFGLSRCLRLHVPTNVFLDVQSA